jgi:hypothetical protein
MDEIQHLRAQAERYYRLAKQINDPRVIAALHAMAEETEEAIVALNPTVSFDLPERVLRHLSAARTAWQCAQQGTCEADAQSCN